MALRIASCEGMVRKVMYSQNGHAGNLGFFLKKKLLLPHILNLMVNLIANKLNDALINDHVPWP